LIQKKKLELLYKFDDILGIGIREFIEEKIKIPQEIKQLAIEREKLRKEKKWAEADIIRDRIQERGFKVQDTQDGYNLEKI
jgi:cysteinyl-tRNA synthetase